MKNADTDDPRDPSPLSLPLQAALQGSIMIDAPFAPTLLISMKDEKPAIITVFSLGEGRYKLDITELPEEARELVQPIRKLTGMVISRIVFERTAKQESEPERSAKLAEAYAVLKLLSTIVDSRRDMLAKCQGSEATRRKVCMTVVEGVLCAEFWYDLLKPAELAACFLRLQAQISQCCADEGDVGGAAL
jgi:hypothetical protein